MHARAIVTVLRVEGLDLKHHWTAGLRLSACKMAQTPLGHDPPPQVPPEPPALWNALAGSSSLVCGAITEVLC